MIYLYRLYLATGPYADVDRADCWSTMSRTVRADIVGADVAAFLRREIPAVQAMYRERFTHYWLLGQAGHPGDLASLRRWLDREGLIADACG